MKSKRHEDEIIVLNNSIKRLYGIIEDVLVKVEKNHFIIDYVVFDTPKNEEIPLIFGCSFFLTSRSNIIVEEGTIPLKIYNEIIKLNMLKAIKLEENKEDCYLVTMINFCVKNVNESHIQKLSLKRVMSISYEVFK